MGPVLIVEARFYDDLADALLDGARRALASADVAFEIVTVPGALEIPGAIALAAHGAATGRGPKYSGFVALGCVIRGETTHYDIVANESARGIMDLTVRERLAIGNGILTCEDEEQAWARARATEMDKGGGAAKACLAMIDLKRRFGLPE